MFIYVPVKEMNVIDVYEINHVHLSITDNNFSFWYP